MDLLVCAMATGKGNVEVLDLEISAKNHVRWLSRSSAVECSATADIEWHARRKQFAGDGLPFSQVSSCEGKFQRRRSSEFPGGTHLRCWGICLKIADGQLVRTQIVRGVTAGSERNLSRLQTAGSGNIEGKCGLNVIDRSP